MKKTTKQTNDETEDVSSNLQGFVNKIKKMKMSRVLIILYVLGTLFLFNVGAIFPERDEEPIVTETVDSLFVEVENYPLVVRERLHDELVNEVRMFINRMAPSSKIDPDKLVTLCQQYDIDITFVLAQGLIESHFGTKGKAAQTNSVFNVGTFDNNVILYRYKNPNESIEPYLKLLQNDYLVKRTLKQLLNNGGFINHDGKRYASAPFYEQSLRTTISSINIETSIKMYQDVMNLSDEKILAYFGPVAPMDSQTFTASIE